MQMLTKGSHDLQGCYCWIVALDAMAALDSANANTHAWHDAPSSNQATVAVAAFSPYLPA
jgi:hypothetical protein